MTRDLQAEKRKRRRRFARWRRRILLLVAVLALVWFAPLIVSQTELRNWAARQALADFKGSVTIGRASLGWLSPVVLEDADLRDPAGRSVLTAARIESQKTLIDLLCDPHDLGVIRVTRPSINVVCTGDGTNVEEMLDSLRKPAAAGPAGEGTAVNLEVKEGQLAIHDADTDRKWTLTSVSLALNLSRSSQVPLRCEVHGSLPGTGKAGQIDATITTRQATDSGESRNFGEVHATLDGVPMALAWPFLRRVAPVSELDGKLAGKLECRWGDEKAEEQLLHLDGHVTVNDLAVAAEWLGKDRLRLEKIEVPCRLTMRGGVIQVERLELTCDLGKASVAGHFDTTQDLMTALARPGQELSADCDLARLAAALPNLLSLRADTRITTGRVHLNATSSTGPRGLAWKAKVQTSDLAAVNQGRTITWKEPLALDLTARQPAPNTVIVSEVRCDSQFLKLDASSSGDRWIATARCDLDALSSQAAHFVNLGAIRLAGQGSARLELKNDADGHFTGQGDVQLKGFQLAGLSPRPFQEPNLTLRLAASGLTDARGQQRIDSGSLTLQCEQDVLELRLLEPMVDLTRGPWGMVQVHVSGELARWQQRLRPWVETPPGCQMAGLADLTVRVRGTSATVALEDLKLALRDVRLLVAGMVLTEPAVGLQTSARWHPEQRRLELSDTHLACAALSARTPRLLVSLTPQGHVDVIGSASVQGDLARLQKWLPADPAAGPPEPMAGLMTGQVDLQQLEGRVGARADLTIRGLTVGPPNAAWWREPEAQVVLRGQYDPATDFLRIDQLRLAGTSLACDGEGKLARVLESQDFSLAGKLHYDLEKLTPQLRSYLGAGLRMSGRDARPFRIDGSLAALRKPAAPMGQPARTPPAVTLVSWAGETGANWQSASYHGFQAGPAELHARLAEGWLRLDPVECAVNQGRMRVEPSIRFEPGPLEMQLATGPVLQQVRITPEMSHSALAYMAPVFAGATEADGLFSVYLNGGQVPLAAPTRSNIGGRLTIHRARIGPTPLLRELAVLLQGGTGTADLVRESVVTFHLVDGRVHHRDLELRFPDMIVKTSGSVGLDGSLAMVAEMPIPPKWIGNRKVPPAVAKKTIQVPIRGTLERPRLDEQALRAASGQFLKESGGEMLRKELDSQIEQLLRRLR